jgi:hypothetical protein
MLGVDFLIFLSLPLVFALSFAVLLPLPVMSCPEWAVASRYQNN